MLASPRTRPVVRFVGPVLLAFALGGGLWADEKPRFVPAPIEVGDAPVVAVAAVGASRAELDVPDAVWAAALEGLGLPADAVLGYTSDQMAGYGRDQRITRPVATMFRDVRALPRFTGKLAEDLLAAARDPSEVVRTAHGLTDAVAGRMLERPKGDAWGAAWLPDPTTPHDALPIVLERLASRVGGHAGPMDEAAAAAWRRLPAPLARFVVRVLVGSAEALPWIRVAFDERFLVGAVGAHGPAGLTPRELYRLATRPWSDEDPADSPALSRASFEALGRVDRDYLAYASVLLTLHLAVALEEWRTAAAGVDLSALTDAALFVHTPVGAVRVLGPGADIVDGSEGPALLVLDLGGDDTYTGRVAVPSYPSAPLSTWIDLAGNDTWDGGELEGALGCGLFGAGVLVDLKGNDRYTVKASGLGCAWYGTGLLYDAEGDDAYVVKGAWGQGAAHVGAGVLIDLAGNDTYECAQQSQGLGSTYGAGVLLDVAGNDRYVARDDGNRQKIYNDQSVAMAQGCGYGRRADLSDGHSLAGGYGVLVDGAGDDHYHAQCWAQGCGYWWGVGLLEDLGGDDVYENGKYSLGAAAHFAIGVHVDLSGDDRYNEGVETAVNQYQGHARDGSIGVSIDGGGNDRYQLRNHCGGSADLGSIGLFFDRGGDDVYTLRWNPLGPPGGWAETPPMGTATRYEAFRSFRDRLWSYGVFLDTGGKDTYAWTNLPEDAALYPAGVPFGADGRRWTHRPGGPAAGVGLDLR